MGDRLSTRMVIEVDGGGDLTLLVAPSRHDKTVVRLLRDLSDKLESKEYESIPSSEEEKIDARSWR